MFTPETADLPDVWPPCRAAGCGSTAAVARIDAPLGPIVVTCENGHRRGSRTLDDFRGRGRYAGVFSCGAVTPGVPRDAPERRLEPGSRRRSEVLEDAERCALCATPPAGDSWGDRAVWTWVQRWRPALFASLLEALAIVRRRERVTFGNWRLEIPAALRNLVVRELADSELQTDHVIPLPRLLPLTASLTARELKFAVNRLLIAICRRCNEGRWHARMSREDFLRDYVAALHDGDERRARAAAAEWAMMEELAAQAARVRFADEARTA